RDCLHPRVERGVDALAETQKQRGIAESIDFKLVARAAAHAVAGRLSAARRRAIRSSRTARAYPSRVPAPQTGRGHAASPCRRAITCTCSCATTLPSAAI